MSRFFWNSLIVPYLVFWKNFVRFGLPRETESPLRWVLKHMTMSLFEEASEIFLMSFFPSSVRNSPSNYRDLLIDFRSNLN